MIMEKHTNTDGLRQFPTILDSLQEGIQIIDYQWRYVYVNAVMQQQGKTRREELIGRTMMDAYAGIELTPLFEVLKACMHDREPRRIENQFTCLDLSVRWFDLRISAVPEGICILSIDITSNKETEEKIIKSNSLYAFISQINQKIVRVDDEKSLFRYACSIAIEFGKFRMAWIGMFEDSNNTTTLVEQSGIPPKALSIFKEALREPNKQQDYVRQTGKYYISNDIQKEAGLEPWKYFAAKHDIHSCVLLPIKKSGKVIGILNLYSTKLHYSDEEEIALLEEVAKDISFAVDRIEKYKKLAKTEKLLLKSEQLFRHTLDNMIEGTQIHDFNWRYTYVNDALVKYSTYTREELIGYTVMEKYPGIEQTDLFKVMERCMIERVGGYLETEFVFPDGSKADFELSIQPIPEGVFILSIDRTEQKKATEKLHKVNRLYAFISAINQSIVHIDNEQQLLDSACDIAANIGGFSLAKISIIDVRNNNNLRTISVNGKEDAVKGAENYADMNYNDQLLYNTATGRALRSGNYAVCNDIPNDVIMKPRESDLSNNIIMSCISLPIKKFGKVIGIFELYSDIKDFFDDEEITLLKEAAGDISFALENFEKAKRLDETKDLVAKTENRFRVLIEKSADIKTLATEDGKYIYCSPSIRKVLGYEIKELLNESLYALIHPEDIALFIENRNKILKTPGKSFYFQHRRLHKKGHWIWCEGSVTNMLHEPGIMAMVSNFRDISEKKMAENQLKKNEAFIKEVLNSLSAHIAVIDVDGNIVAVNEAWKKFSLDNGGHVFQEKHTESNYFKVCEKSFNQGDSIADIALRGIKEVMDKKQTQFYYEYPCDSEDQKRWFSLLARPFKGDEQLVVMAHQDISQRKFAEEELIKNNDELLKTNLELDRFAYSVSHDLRSPLTSVLGLIGFIEEESKEPETQEHVRMIKSSISRLDESIKNILNYSRNKRTELEVEKILIHATIDEIITSLNGINLNAKIHFQINIQENLPFHSDRQRFIMVLENLISNAIKYHNEDENNRYIKITGVVNNQSLSLKIADNGIGIAAANHEKIFDMFFRLSSKLYGSGIGLYIVKESIEKLEGSIKLNSEIGKGTTFNIILKNFKP